ncbi:MAG: YciI family protein [Caulobacteraceae bacterium]
MRVMVIVKANPESEAGALPSPEYIEAMGAFNNELIAAGVMLDGGGLRPSASGARVRLQSGEVVVTDGPFAETKELIGGYWIWQVKSLADAVAWASKAPTEGDRPRPKATGPSIWRSGPITNPRTSPRWRRRS